MKTELRKELINEGFTAPDLDIAEKEGWCKVNDILLKHIDRYRYAEMQFCMPKSQIKKIEKHLKDCPDCLQIIYKKNPDSLSPKLESIEKQTKRTGE